MLRIIPYVLRFKNPAKTSRDTLKLRPVWFLVLEEKGLRGIGEIAPIAGLSSESTDELGNYLQQLRNTPLNVLQSDALRLGFTSLSFAIETAILDLKNGGRRELFASPFIASAQPIPINGLIWMGNQDFMFQQVKQKIAQGFSCIKLKIGGIDFKEELQIIKYIRTHFSANQIEIRLDANGAFSAKDAQEKLSALAQFSIHSIEQPIKAGQWDEMARLCRNNAIPIALDEELIGISRQDKQAELLQTIAPQYIILKPSLLGGFSVCDHWIALAEAQKIGWWATSALESNIGLNAIAQWVSAKGTGIPQGLGTGGLYTNNIDSPLMVREGALYYDKAQPWDLKIIDGQ